jgi:hypothetical protein
MINIKRKAMDYTSQLLQNKNHGLNKIIITRNEF